MHKRLERLAKKNGRPVTDLVNQLLKKDLEVAGKLVVSPDNQASHVAASRDSMKTRNLAKDTRDVKEDRLLINIADRRVATFDRKAARTH